MTFTIPWESLIGGMLVGISAVMLLLVNGKIAGISGILSGLLSPKKKEFFWRVLFIVGMIFGGIFSVYFFEIKPVTNINANFFMIFTAGLLVGIGTCVGNGCTSGHGICGIGRFSKRSIVATAVFMVVAIITVFVRLHFI